MSASLAFDLSGLPVRLRIEDAALARAMSRAWSEYAGGEEGTPVLDLRVEIGAEALPEGDRMRAGGESRLAIDEASYRFAEGTVHVRDDGTGTVRVGTGEVGHQRWALVNLVLAAAGWRLPSIGGAVLHAAAVVVEGRAFVLVGPEGAGKTTWARLAESAGVRAVSDDVVVVRETGGAFEALATPFRTQTLREGGPGRWPVAAILLARHGESAALATVRRLVLEATVTANLLYLAGAPPEDTRPARVVARLLDVVPARTLVFSRDAGFVELLRRFA